MDCWDGKRAVGSGEEDGSWHCGGVMYDGDGRVWGTMAYVRCFKGWLALIIILYVAFPCCQDSLIQLLILDS